MVDWSYACMLEGPHSPKHPYDIARDKYVASFKVGHAIKWENLKGDKFEGVIIDKAGADLTVKLDNGESVYLDL